MKKILIFLLLVGMINSPSFGENIKKPNVSGQFYTNNPSKLSSQIEAFLDAVPDASQTLHVEVLVSPHAGYIYSGGVAAHGYKLIQNKPYKTVVIIAPSHHFSFDSFSVWQEGKFETPLGMIEIDEKFAKELTGLNKKFVSDQRVFEREHSLEVQLPFLQKTLTDFKIVPIISGHTSYELCEEMAKALDKLIADRDDILVIASSDLSHFHNYNFAKNMDRRTIQCVENLRIEDFWNKIRSGEMEMCGFIPVTVSMLFAKQRGLEAKILNYANSGDVTGDMGRVVGYSSIMFGRKGSGKKEEIDAPLDNLQSSFASSGSSIECNCIIANDSE